MASDLIEIDGSAGEGGGQILRTSLALSIITRRPLRMQHIRARRAKPGLRRQHLACVEAAAQLCNAEVSGAKLGSQELAFAPGEAFAETLDIDIGSAGSTTLVVQTVLVPALVARTPLRLVVHGGTHNPLAPPFDFLARVFAPHLRAMGGVVELVLDRHGFASGRDIHDEANQHRGQLTVTTAPSTLGRIDIVDAPELSERHATAILARLPTHVADRELERVRERLGFGYHECEVREVRDAGTGNVLMLEVARGPHRELVTAFGEKGVRAELVADRACSELAAFLAVEVPVGEHLADQLLLPLAVAGGGRFRSAPLSLHATTNIETIARFLDVTIRVERVDDRSVIVYL